MKVGIIECSGSPHEPHVLAIARVLVEKGSDVHVLTTPTHADRLIALADGELGGIKIQTTNFGAVGIIANILRGRFDQTVVVTTSVRTVVVGLVASLVSPKATYVVQNIMMWFRLPSNRASAVDRVKQLVVHWGCFFIKRRAYSFIVEFESLRSRLFGFGIQRVDVVPFGLPPAGVLITHNAVMSKQRDIIIAVPGVVDVAKKNIAGILAAMERIENKLQAAITIEFLGKVNSVSELGMLRDFQARTNIRVFYTEAFITQKEFDRRMAAATVLLSWMYTTHSCRLLEEIYGETKATAIEGHAVRFSKPLLVNSGYKSHRRDSGFLTFADSCSLGILISRLVSEPELLCAVTSSASEYSTGHTVCKVARNVRYI